MALSMDPTAARFKFELTGVKPSLAVARFEGEEAISELYRFDLWLASYDPLLSFSTFVGHPALLTLSSAGDEQRYVHGIVSRFTQGEEGKSLAVYRATLVPKVWRLQYRHDVRIFQELSVGKIIERVLEGAGVAASEYRLNLQHSHPTREYCVQYRESDWAFISRLMEEEGIFYYFTHGPSGEVLVMSDGRHTNSAIAAPAQVVYRPLLGALAHAESVTQFSYSEEIRPGKVSLTDFNFKKPNVSLLAAEAADIDADRELYDYPGEYDLPGDGSAIAKVRLEEQQAVRRTAHGQSGCVRFTAGHTFSLSEHPRDHHNRGYLLTRVRHHGSEAVMGEASGAQGDRYELDFEAIPDDVVFRPRRATPRPTVKGVQTAIVVGPSGEEIYSDEHGRVKVQFFWDRKGSHNDKSSCWIRVSQLWAGAGWGAMTIPRIGQEVVVDFIEGDPDRPIITGRVYHGTNNPPYPLPAQKTKSTWKSNSSPGGDGFNELRFEDKKGAEEIFVHAQKDMRTDVLNDKAEHVVRNRTRDVSGNESIHVAKKRQVSVDGSQKHYVKGTNKQVVLLSHSEVIGGLESVKVAGVATRTVGGAQLETVGAYRRIRVKAYHDEAIGANMKLTVGRDKREEVGGASAEIVSKNKTSTVLGDSDVSVSKKLTVAVNGDKSEVIGESANLEVGKSITVSCGKVKIRVDKDGKVDIEADKLNVTMNGNIQVKAKDVKVDSSGTVEVNASGTVKIKGGSVGFN